MTTPTPDHTATAALAATAAAEAALAEVLEVLSKVDVPSEGGHLAWTQTDPLPITADGGNQNLYEPFAPEQEFADFVLAADVTWESTGGVVGCGFIFRSEENFEHGDQYQFITTRFSGLPLWAFELYKQGEWVMTLGGRPKVNSALNQDNGSVNKYVLVIDGDIFTAYANGERLGRGTSVTLTEGYLAFTLWQESGKTTCTMENAWVWVIR